MTSTSYYRISEQFESCNVHGILYTYHRLPVISVKVASCPTYEADVLETQTAEGTDRELGSPPNGHGRNDLMGLWRVLVYRLWWGSLYSLLPPPHQLEAGVNACTRHKDGTEKIRILDYATSDPNIRRIARTVETLPLDP
jgi:hypothetical protein